MKNNLSFTLIELLLVIAIIGILSIMGFFNYFNSIKSARDARRKSDLATIQQALEEYYLDNSAYPIDFISDPFCHPDGCSTARYLPHLPTDKGTPYTYESTDGTYYKLYACIENSNDIGPGVDQSGYGVSCGVSRCDPCRYIVTSTNVNP